MKKPKTSKWTEEAITQSISMVMMVLGIDRMPTKSEVIEVTGSTALKEAISRRGGFVHWAKKLGLEMGNAVTMPCVDCGQDVKTSKHNRAARCPECTKVYRYNYQKNRYASEVMTKPMDRTTDIIIVRAMRGRRKQTAKEVAEDLEREPKQVQERVRMLKETGDWDKIWAYLQARDRTAEIYGRSTC